MWHVECTLEKQAFSKYTPLYQLSQKEGAPNAISMPPHLENKTLDFFGFFFFLISYYHISSGNVWICSRGSSPLSEVCVLMQRLLTRYKAIVLNTGNHD